MTELLSQLGIEWKILVAQVVNFGILFFVLRHFLYKPILKMLDRRRNELVKDKEDRVMFGGKLRELEKTREGTLQKAREESAKILKLAEAAGSKMKDELLKETQKESEKMRLDAKKAMVEEKQVMMRDIKSEVGSIVALAISKSLGDILDEKAEEKLTSQAISKINSIGS